MFSLMLQTKDNTFTEALMSLLLKMCFRLYGYQNDEPIQVVGDQKTGQILVDSP